VNAADQDPVRRWRSISDWYAGFANTPEWGFSAPMVGLAAWVAEQPFAAPLFPGTALEWLYVSLQSGFHLERPFFSCRARGDGQFECELWAGHGSSRSHRVAPLDQAPEVFVDFVGLLSGLAMSLTKSTEWYYLAAGTEVGPLAGAKLLRYALDGEVDPDTPVRHGRYGRWVRAARVKGLFPTTRINRAAAIQIAQRLALDTSLARPIVAVGDVITRDGGRTWIVHLVPEPIDCRPGVIAFDTPGTWAVCVNSETATGNWVEML
jgi:GYF domain 2